MSTAAAKLSAVRFEAYRCTVAIARTIFKCRNDMVTRAWTTHVPTSTVSVASLTPRVDDGDASLEDVGCSGGFDAEGMGECDGEGSVRAGEAGVAGWCRLDALIDVKSA